MLVLESKGAATDARCVRTAGIGDFDLFDFEREAKRPDGTAVKVAFSLAFARDATRPESALHLPAALSREFLESGVSEFIPTSVTPIAGVTMVAENPTDHRIFLKAFTGVRELQSNSTGITSATPTRR